MRSPSFACVTPYGYNRWCGSDPTPLAGQKAVRRLLEGAGSLLSSAPLFGLALDDGLHEPRVGRLALCVHRVHLLAELRLPLRVPVRETRPRAGPKHVLPRICRGKEGTGGSVLASADFLASAHDVRSARSPVGSRRRGFRAGARATALDAHARARTRITPRGAPGSRRGANPKSGVRSGSCVSGRFAEGSGRGSGDALRRTGSLRRALMYICMQNPRPPPMSVVVAGISTADDDTAAARCVHEARWKRCFAAVSFYPADHQETSRRGKNRTLSIV